MISNSEKEEIGHLITDVLNGKLSRQTAKPGSSYDLNRKMIVKGVVSGKDSFHQTTGKRTDIFRLTVNDMFQIFKSGMNFKK